MPKYKRLPHTEKHARIARALATILPTPIALKTIPNLPTSIAPANLHSLNNPQRFAPRARMNCHGLGRANDQPTNVI